MPNFTENYNFKKPTAEEFYNIEDFNENMDIADAALKALATEDTVFKGNIKDLQANITSLNANLKNLQTADTNLQNNINASLATINSTLKNLQIADTNLQTNINNVKNIKGCRFVIGTKTSGHTEQDCDYLCNGVDDQVEINNALNALPSTGGEIQLLDGVYNITEQIKITRTYTTIRGNGKNTILKKTSNFTKNNGGEMISLPSYGTISALVVDGNKNGLESPAGGGIWANSYSYITNIEVRNFVNYGITQRGNYGYIGESSFHDNKDGITLFGSYNVRVIGNHVFNNETGINSVEEGTIVSNNTIYDNKIGIDISTEAGYNTQKVGVHKYSRSIVSSNIIYNNTTYGIESTGLSGYGSTFYPSGYTIIGNVIYGSSSPMYFHSLSKDLIVIGNVLDKSLSVSGSGHYVAYNTVYGG